MKTLINSTGIFLLFMLLLNGSYGQTDQKSVHDVNFNVTYNKEAHFPEGEQSLYRYIYSNIVYTEDAKTNKLNASVLVSFDVLIDSTITNVVFLSNPGYGVSDEIERILKQLKFAPALANSKPIVQSMMLSIPVNAAY